MVLERRCDRDLQDREMCGKSNVCDKSHRWEGCLQFDADVKLNC